MVDTESVTQERPAGDFRPELRRQAVVGGIFAAVLTMLGVPVAWVWSMIAPRAGLIVLDAGQTALADAESTAYMTGDGQFALLTMGVGAVVAVVAYVVAGRRRAGIGAVLGLAAGGLLGSLVAWLLARWPSADAYADALRSARVGDQISAALTLHARGVLMLGALAAVAVFGLIEVCVSTVRD